MRPLSHPPEGGRRAEPADCLPSSGHVAIATDIAFALAALGVVGRRAPAELRTFLLTLDVVDDLATIAVIAIFFSKGLSLICLYGGAVVDRCA